MHYSFVNIWPPLSQAPRDLRSLILQIITYLMRYLVRRQKSKIYFEKVWTHALYLTIFILLAAVAGRDLNCQLELCEQYQYLKLIC